MLLDPNIEHRKFEREVALLQRNAARLAALGVWILRTKAPNIDAVFVPHLPVRVGLPSTASPSGILVVPSQKLQFKLVDIPSVSGRAFGVRVDLHGYDQRAPSITFHDPWSWEPAPYAALPVGQLVEDPKKPLIVLLDGHPTLGKRPFLCLRGVREYHDHPQHDGDDWAMYRAATNVYVLLERIARITLASVRPQMLVMLQTAGAQVQMQLSVQWAPETPR